MGVTTSGTIYIIIRIDHFTSSNTAIPPILTRLTLMVTGMMTRLSNLPERIRMMLLAILNSLILHRSRGHLGLPHRD